jgi:hypothetical protein
MAPPDVREPSLWHDFIPPPFRVSAVAYKRTAQFQEQHLPFHSAKGFLVPLVASSALVIRTINSDSGNWLPFDSSSSSQIRSL